MVLAVTAANAAMLWRRKARTPGVFKLLGLVALAETVCGLEAFRHTCRLWCWKGEPWKTR